MSWRTEALAGLCIVSAASIAACGTDDAIGTSTSTGGSAVANGGASQGGMVGAGGSATVGGAGGAQGGSAGASPIETARCGLDYSWLPPTSVGSVVSQETPHGSLSVVEAAVAKLLLASQGIGFNRNPDYETLAHRIVYSTQDRGQAREATGLVVVPQVSQTQSFPVILFHHGTTGLTDICAPTYGLEDTNSEAYAVALLLSLISSFGYIVVAPDYLGQKSVGPPSPSLHPYLIGEPTAVAAWDAARAAKALLDGDNSSATFGKVVLWGASQGGHAAMYSALYHSFYAPEMDLVAGVYSVPPSDLETHMTRGTRELWPATGNTVLFYVAADAWYQPSLSPGLSEIFVPPIDTQAPTDLAADCSPNTLDGTTSVDQVFTTALIAASQTEELVGYEPWGCFLRENSMTRTSLPPPSVPGLFILAENDTLVWPPIERAAFDTLCAQGHQLSYLECAGAQHEEGFFWAIDDALDYIDDRLAGSPVVGACTPAAPQTCANTP